MAIQGPQFRKSVELASSRYPKTEAAETTEEKKGRLVRHSSIALLYYAMREFQRKLSRLPLFGKLLVKGMSRKIRRAATQSVLTQETPRTTFLTEFKLLITAFDQLLGDIERLIQALFQEVQARDPNNSHARIRFIGGGVFSGLNYGLKWPKPNQPRDCTPEELKEILKHTQHDVHEHLTKIQAVRDTLRNNGGLDADHCDVVGCFEQRVNTITQNIQTIFTTLDSSSSHSPVEDLPTNEESIKVRNFKP